MSRIPPPPVIHRPFAQINTHLLPRLQWNHNGGYCGETSVIIAGLNYGQYLSQFDMRAIASPGMPQNSQTYPGVKNSPDAYYNAQLLLGVNDDSAATSVHLQNERKKSDDTAKFLTWVKRNVANGHPVVIGVFNNMNMLGESGTGDPEYDHIVTVVGYGSMRSLQKSGILPDDQILIMDNGLYTPDGNNNIPYYYLFSLNKFLCNRKQANNPAGPVYSLLNLPKYQSKNPGGEKFNYGLLINGVSDAHKETLPVQVLVSRNSEKPSIGSDSCSRPAEENIKLTITVSGLIAGKSYNLYYFNDEKNVPVKNFNRAGKKPWKTFSGSSGSSKSFHLSIRSSSKAFFRATEA